MSGVLTGPDVVPALPDGQTGYALGFAFDDRGRVALISKLKPAWQAGKLNGIGGHIEPGETPGEAMRREFLEEAGVTIDCWEHAFTLQFGGGAVWVFRAAVPGSVLDAARTCTAEQVVILDRGDVIAGTAPTLPNLPWMASLCAYRHDTYEPFVIVERD